jgi:accessory gene regulator protein AgrB
VTTRPVRATREAGAGIVVEEGLEKVINATKATSTAAPAKTVERTVNQESWRKRSKKRIILMDVLIVRSGVIFRIDNA